jgi:hypothetical protein
MGTRVRWNLHGAAQAQTNIYRFPDSENPIPIGWRYTSTSGGQDAPAACSSSLWLYCVHCPAPTSFLSPLLLDKNSGSWSRWQQWAPDSQRSSVFKWMERLCLCRAVIYQQYGNVHFANILNRWCLTGCWEIHSSVILKPVWVDKLVVT